MEIVRVYTQKSSTGATLHKMAVRMGGTELLLTISADAYLQLSDLYKNSSHKSALEFFNWNTPAYREHFLGEVSREPQDDVAELLDAAAALKKGND